MRTTLLITASVLALSLPATAQQTTPGGVTTRDEPAAITAPLAGQRVQGAQPEAVQLPAQKQEQGTFRTTQMVGANVLNGAGEQVANIDDLITKPDGSIQQVVLGFGGFLGLGEKKVAVDFDAVRFNRDGTSVAAQIAMTTDELRNAPAFEYGGQQTSSQSK